MAKSKKMNILFLGAGKRLSLLERFREAGINEDVNVMMWSVEDSKQVPIAIIANILVGPRFKDLEFNDFLMDVVLKYKIDLIIPNMDAATVQLAKLKYRLVSIKCKAVVSEYSLCLAMEDKIFAAKWFIDHGLSVPAGDDYPRIIKSRLGYGSRDQWVVYSNAEFRLFFSNRVAEEYFDQPLISGQEYTVDAYVERTGRVLGVLSRKRIKVSAGEVDVSETHRHKSILDLTSHVLSFKGWEGPITLQFIDSERGPVIIEVNPRFGGGVTHSIHCGLDMPRWIIREQLGRALKSFDEWSDGSIMTRCRRDFFYDDIDRS